MILLVNDDGIDTPGLRALYHTLRQRLDLPVLAVAPQVQRSGSGHAITLDRALVPTPVLEDDFFGFAIDGTPADCLKLALKVLCPAAPRLVVSGINEGPNVGRSLFYSGTVAAAMEAAVEGFPAMAVSRDVSDNDECDDAAAYAAELAEACLGRRELRGRVLNCNVPASPRSDWRDPLLLPHGMSGFDEQYRPGKRRGGTVGWRLHGERRELEGEGETDAHGLRDGHPVLTFLKPDLNPTDGPGRRWQDRLLAVGRPQ